LVKLILKPREDFIISIDIGELIKALGTFFFLVEDAIVKYIKVDKSRVAGGLDAF